MADKGFGLPSPNEFDGSKTTSIQGTVGAYAVGTYPVVDPDDAASGAISAASGALVVSNLQQAGTVGVKITGTWSGTLVFEQTIDGSNWDSATVFTGTTGVTTATANGSWLGPAQGYQAFRVRSSSWTSGTATIAIRVSAAPFTFAAASVTATFTGTGPAGTQIAVGVSNIGGQNHLLVYDDQTASKLDSIILILTDINMSLRAISSESTTGRGLASTLQGNERTLWP